LAQADIWLLGAPADAGQRQSLARLADLVPPDSAVVIVNEREADLKAWSAWPAPQRPTIFWLKAAGDSAPAVIGDLVGVLAKGGIRCSDLPHDLMDSAWPRLIERVRGPHTTVAVWGSTGRPGIRFGLAAAAGYAGIPVYIDDQEGGADERPPVQPTPWLLADAAARAVDSSARVHGQADGVTDLAFLPLLRQYTPGAAGPCQPTVLLHRLWQDEDLALRQYTASAVAKLLDEFDYREEARQLRDLVNYWVRTNPWGQNYVPEMVGHGQAHGAAVERNVAQLARPFVRRKGADPSEDGFLSGHDLLDLAAAAWLHDWGHGSALDFHGHPIKVTASEARDWHGLLTQERLHSRQTEAFPPGLKFSGDIRAVGALSSHHQGWTCFGDTDGEAEEAGKKKRPSQYQNLAPHKVYCDMARTPSDHAGRHGGDMSRCKTPGNAREHAAADHFRNKLAIIRLADAADIGIHRAPDYETQRERNGWIALESAAAEAAEAGLGRDQSKLLLHTVQEAVERVHPTSSRETIQEVFASAADEAKSNGIPDALIKHVFGTGKTGYPEHVVSQFFFFNEQRAVRLAVPVLGQDRRLRLAVVPTLNPPDGLDAPEALVRGLVVRELGEQVPRQSDLEPPDALKQAAAFKRLASMRAVVRHLYHLAPDDPRGGHAVGPVDTIVLSWADCLAGLDRDSLCEAVADASVSIGPDLSYRFRDADNKWQSRTDAAWTDDYHSEPAESGVSRRYKWSTRAFGDQRVAVRRDGSIDPRVAGLPDTVMDIDVSEGWAAFVDCQGRAFVARPDSHDRSAAEATDWWEPILAESDGQPCEAAHVAFARYFAPPARLGARQLDVTLTSGETAAFVPPTAHHPFWHARGRRA
jgi:hypothetical protein